MSVRDQLTERTYLAYLAIPRIVVGYFFFVYGWQKLNLRFLSGEQLAMQLARAANDPLAFHRDFILQTVTPHSQFFAYLIAYGEIAIGLSLIFGLLVRLSSAFGMFHNLNIMFALDGILAKRFGRSWMF